MGKFNQAKYIQEFEKENYDRILVRLPKGYKEKLKKHLGSKSMNNYFIKKVEEDIKKEPKSND